MGFPMIKVFPDIIFSALKHHQPASAYRLWFIAKDLNPGGVVLFLPGFSDST